MEIKDFTHIAFVSFSESNKLYTFGKNDDTLKVHDKVVVETVRGLEVGTIMKENQLFENVSSELEIKPGDPEPTAKDLKDVEDKKAAEKAMDCEEAIEAQGLDMHLIEAEYTLDRSKIIFVYVADDRVDFRELLKDLATKSNC